MVDFPNYTVPAIKGHMGSTKYYQAVLRADELAATVHAAMDFPEFDSFMASERMQRKMNEERVETQIVPYLTNSADRFFGSIIVLAYQPDEFTFEPLKELGMTRLPGAYSGIENTIGALTISGGKLFALDGQHRLHALRTVVNEKVTPHLGLPITGPYKDAVKDDMLSVIFVEFTTVEKARRIFNKVNRYAKPTTKSTNILTSEDDGYAIIARCVAGLDDPGKFDSDIPAPIPQTFYDGSDVLKIEGSSLKPADDHLTTLELVYKTIEAISLATKQPPLDEKTTIVRPEDDVLRTAYEVCARWWQELVDNFQPFADAFDEPDMLSSWRDASHPSSIAYRPNGQEALIRGLMDAHKIVPNLSMSTLVGRMNQLPLSFGDEVWLGVLMGGGEQKSRVLNFKPLAANLVTYMLIGADAYGARRTQALLDAYIEAKAGYGIIRRVLPKSVV